MRKQEKKIISFRDSEHALKNMLIYAIDTCQVQIYIDNKIYCILIYKLISIFSNQRVRLKVK